MTATFREIENTALEGTLCHAKKLLLFGIMAILLSGAAISLQLAKSIEMPIKRLKTSAKQIAMGDFSAEIDIRGNDELASFSSSFDSIQIILNNVLQALDDRLKDLRKKIPTPKS